MLNCGSLTRCLAGFVVLSSLLVGSAAADVVSVDLAAKTAVSDSDSFKPRVRVIGDQIVLCVDSTDPQLRKFTLKVNGLTPGEQDLYINASYKGKRTASDFAQGVEFSIPGRAVNPDQFRCIESVRDRIGDAMKRLDGIKEDEYIRVVYTLRAAADRVSDATLADQRARSVELMITPAGAVARVKSKTPAATAAESAEAYIQACSMLQEARDRMYDNITNFMKGDLRNEAVAALTPVDLKLSYYRVNGKLRGTALLINSCDLPVSGDVTVAVPAGWAVKVNKSTFLNLASGKSFKADFALVPAKNANAAPPKISARGAMTIALNTWMAKLTLEASASLPGATPPATKAASSGASTKG